MRFDYLSPFIFLEKYVLLPYMHIVDIVFEFLDSGEELGLEK